MLCKKSPDGIVYVPSDSLSTISAIVIGPGTCATCSATRPPLTRLLVC